MRLIVIVWMAVLIMQPRPAKSREAENNNAVHNIETLVRQKTKSCSVVRLVDISADLQSYLKEKELTKEPGVVIADFNGDGKEDYALLLRCKNRSKNQTIEKFVVLLGIENNDYKWIFINQWEDQLSLTNLYLRRINSTTLIEVNHGKAIKIINPAVELNLYEAAAKVYYWKDGKFKYVQVSD